MTKHLSPEQTAGLVTGGSTSEEAQHARECTECGAKVMRLRETLSVFGVAVRHWTAQNGGAAVPNPVFLRTGTPSFRRRTIRWALAVAAAILLVAIPVYQNKTNRHRQADAADALLLEQVNAHLSRAVPAAMEPWLELLSDSSSDGIGGRE